MKRIVFLALLVAGAAHAQTIPDMVWSTLTASCENGNARNNCGTSPNQQAWRLSTTAPTAPAVLLVAAYRVNNANCATRWWDNTANLIQWTKPENLQPTWCVSWRPQSGTNSTNENLWKKASDLKYPPASTPPTNPAPTAQLGIQPTTVPYLGSALFVWTSTDATACRATGAWTGDLSPSGSMYIGSMYVPSSSFGLTCTGPGGSANARPVTVTVTQPPPPSIAIRAAKNLISVGETVEIVWQSDNTTGCVSNWGEEIDAAGASVRGPFAAPGFHEFRVKCIGVLRGTDVERTTGVNVVAPVAPIPLVPPLMPSPEEITRSLAGIGPVGWGLLETPHATWKIKVTFFVRLPDGRVVRYTYAMSWAELLGYADQVKRTGTYDRAAAAARCATECVELAEGSAMDLELDAFKALPANSREALGVIGE